MFNVFDWMFNMAEKSTERVRKWREMNQERMRELSRKSSAAYRERNKDNPEYIERERETSRKTSAAYRKKMKETMTPEQLEEERRKNRERQARYRERQKLKAAAESKPED